MKKFSMSLVAIISVFLFSNSYLHAQNETSIESQLADEVDTTWVNHYASGVLQGKAEFYAMVTDAVGNVYVTGMINNMISGDDYITIKYNSEGIEQWSEEYNGPGNSFDHPTSIAIDNSGNVYVTGGSDGEFTGRDYATLKYDINGELQWVIRYDGPGNDNNYDTANDLVIDGSGNIYVTGGSNSWTSTDYTTIKYNNEGVEQWVTRYDGPDNEGNETAYYMAIDDSGNIYVTGRSDGPGTRNDYATIKYNNNGVEQWVSRYNGPADKTDQPSAIAVDDSGNVYVTGSSSNAQSRWDYLTVKYNASGIEQWTDRYVGPAGSNDYAKALAIGDSGYVYVTGNSYDGTTKDDFATIKYAPSGVVQWVQRYNGASNSYDKATVIDIDDSGNIYVAGQSSGSTVVKYTPAGDEVWSANYPYIFAVVALSVDASGNSFITGNHYYDCATIKFNNTGIEEWAVTQSGPGLSNDYSTAMALDPSGNLYVAGGSRGFTNYDYSLIKYDPAGVEQWVVFYNGPDSLSESVKAIAVDIAGNVYLTGTSGVGGTNSDWATVKYNSDGVEQWVSRFDGTGNYTDVANALAVDENGNVYVTGYTAKTTSLTDLDYTTIKYDASGFEQWVAYYDGPGQTLDDANAIAVDDSGNVYVTGSSPGIALDRDYATIKYNNQGVEQWVARYNGPGNSNDMAVGIVVDDQGNVIVTGASYGDGSNYDFATIQYNSAGAEQWVKRYNGTGNRSDFPEAIAINDTGDVVVTGITRGTYSDDDFLTIRYNRFGDQMWASIYDGPSYSNDKAKSVAIGENGNVYVTGTSTGYYGSRDYATVKINQQGYREWVMRYDCNYDQAVDVVTDGLGHIYVTGYTSFDSDFTAVSRITTIKYTVPVTAIENPNSSIPEVFQLNQNYPNPFNPSTAISYHLSAVSQVELSVYNVLGKKIATLVSGQQAAGQYQVSWVASGFASGIYFYELTSDGHSQVRKMMLLR